MVSPQPQAPRSKPTVSRRSVDIPAPVQTIDALDRGLLAVQVSRAEPRQFMHMQKRFRNWPYPRGALAMVIRAIAAPACRRKPERLVVTSTRQPEPSAHADSSLVSRVAPTAAHSREDEAFRRGLHSTSPGHRQGIA